MDLFLWYIPYKGCIAVILTYLAPILPSVS